MDRKVRGRAGHDAARGGDGGRPNTTGALPPLLDRRLQVDVRPAERHSTVIETGVDATPLTTTSSLALPVSVRGETSK